MKNRVICVVVFSIFAIGCAGKSSWANDKGMDRFNRDLSQCRKNAIKEIEKQERKLTRRPIGGFQADNSGRVSSLGQNSAKISGLRDRCMEKRRYYKI